MAFKLGDFIWKIKADTKDFDKGVKEADKDTKGLGKQSTKAGNLIKAAFTGAAIAGVAAFTKAVVSKALEAEKAYQVQESAITALNAALKATGQFSEETSADIQAYASELQGLTTVGDESSIALAQIAINAGLTAEQSKDATRDAIGLSKAFGVDLQAAIKATTNAQQGNFDMLNRYVPAVKNATGEVAKQEAANKALSAAFEVATAETETAAGVQTQLQNAIGDSQENIGRYVAEALTPWRRGLLEIITEINNTRAAQLNLDTVLQGEGGSLSQAFKDQSEKVQEYKDAIQAGGAQLTKFLRTNNLTKRSLDETLAAEEATLNVLGQKLRVQEILTDEQRTAAEQTLALAEAEEAEAVALAEYLELVEGRYKETQQGKIDALAEEIEMWEMYLETAVNTAPQVQEILSELIEKYEELTKATEENADATEEAADRRISAEDLWLEALTSRAIREREIRRGNFAFEKEIAFSSVALASSTFGAISSILDSVGAKNRETAIAIKALSAAEAGINTGLAFTKTLVDGGPYPLNLINAGAILASGVAQQVKILSTPIPSFETGGIVPGNSFTGDNVLTRQNSGEMNISTSQQKALFDFISKGATGGSSGPMVVNVQLGKKTLVKAVVDGVNNGLGGVIDARVVR